MDSNLPLIAPIIEERTKEEEAAEDSKNTINPPRNNKIDFNVKTSTIATLAGATTAALMPVNAPLPVQGPVVMREMCKSENVQNIEATPVPIVETVSTHAAQPPVLVQTATATITATTSAGTKQLQQHEHLQQNLNMAKDWAASDIEKKLSENSALLSQWSLILDKNGSCDE